jgi:SAM-dependent methyltransferase
LRALDIGCGAEAELWFPGADLCDSDLNVDAYTSKEIEGRTLYLQDIDLLHPNILAEDRTYDFIWSGNAWGWMKDDTKRVVERELFRLLKSGGRVIIRDVTYIEEDSDEWEMFDIELFLKLQLNFFSEERWISYAYFNKEVHPQLVVESLRSIGFPYLLHFEKLGG